MAPTRAKPLPVQPPRQPAGDPLGPYEVRVDLVCGECGNVLSWRTTMINPERRVVWLEEAVGYMDAAGRAQIRRVRTPNFFAPSGGWCWLGEEQKWHCGC